ncbi:SIS domain-containing protein [Catelliglobosispora koreensis]|uniref:SIS domain-containing protein n=1 Tax=Catelliglobosispora koreensis TaxID=129052 RepID=UPI00036AFC74|nr:hypothetical protein [Catelliglobosispora koreensis]
MTFVAAEIQSQPDCWRRAVALVPEVEHLLPQRGERVAVVGCGTSWFMAMAYASLREAAGHGETDAFAASEFPAGRRYDRVVAITRSGTTTEVLDLEPDTVILGDIDSPAASFKRVIGLPWADEQSVVQTRFATTALTLLRASLGEDLTQAIADASAALTAELPLRDPEQITFLGRGWTVGLAHEAALKCREAAVFWAESYPAMDYRHGPVSIAAPGRGVWAFGLVPDGLPAQVEATGATFVHHDRDPLAELILAQRQAIAIAEAKGINPDEPRNLTRSVVLR